MKNYQEIMLELVDCLRKTSPDTTVSFNLFVDYGSYEFQFSNRTAEDLKRSGISMRNLKGDFIK